MTAAHPLFTDEQLGYLADILAIFPCHTSGEHDPNHHLKSSNICSLQKREAWDRAMAKLGFDPKNPLRKLHEDCHWCNSEESKHRLEHQEWVLQSPSSLISHTSTTTAEATGAEQVLDELDTFLQEWEEYLGELDWIRDEFITPRKELRQQGERERG